MIKEDKEKLEKVIREKKAVPGEITLDIKKAFEPLKERVEKKKRY